MQPRLCLRRTPLPRETALRPSSTEGRAVLRTSHRRQAPRPRVPASRPLGPENTEPRASCEELTALQNPWVLTEPGGFSAGSCHRHASRQSHKGRERPSVTRSQAHEDAGHVHGDSLRPLPGPGAAGLLSAPPSGLPAPVFVPRPVLPAPPGGLCSQHPPEDLSFVFFLLKFSCKSGSGRLSSSHDLSGEDPTSLGPSGGAEGPRSPDGSPDAIPASQTPASSFGD